jgi:hypothetical protein
LSAKKNNYNSEPNNKKKRSNPALEMVNKDFESAWQYTQSSWHERWERNHFLYNGQRTKRSYEGITDSFVPMTFSTVETMVSALFGAKPKFNYDAPQDKQEQKTDILNGLLDYYWDKDQWSMKVINTGRSMIKLGTGIDYFFWDIDHPVMLSVPLRDFFIDPTATRLDNARYIGRRFLTTKDQLASFEIIDLDAEPDADGDYPLKKKYKNVPAVQPGKGGETTDQEEKNLWYGSTLAEPNKDQVEVIEYWTEDRVISVANRATVIEDVENYYKTKAKANGDKYPRGIIPFADARNYVDESLFYAKGDVDFIADEQELLNDLTNQYVDSITFNLNPMFEVDRTDADKVNEIESLPGAVYPYPVRPIVQGNTPADAFNERMNIKSEIRETTASNEVVRGGSTDGAATATEINAQIAGAGQRISLKVTQIENGYFHRVGQIVFRMVQLYVTEPMMVKIIGKDGAKWEEFDPKDFQGNYEPRVQLDITLQAQERQKAADSKEFLAAFLGDPDINQRELKKMVLHRGFNLDPDEVGMLIADEQVPEDMGMQGMPPMEGMGGAPQGMLPEMMQQAPPPDALAPEAQIPEMSPEEMAQLIAMEDAGQIQ